MTWRNDARSKRYNKMRKARWQAIHDLAYGAYDIGGACHIVTRDDMKAAVNAAKHAADTGKPLTPVRGWVRLGAYAWVTVHGGNKRQLFIRRDGKDTSVPLSDAGQQIVDSLQLKQGCV